MGQTEKCNKGRETKKEGEGMDRWRVMRIIQKDLKREKNVSS